MATKTILQNKLPGKRRVLKLDPIRALEPTRKKLSSLESQRIVSLLTDTIERTSLAALITNLSNLDDFGKGIPKDIKEQIREHSEVEKKYIKCREEYETSVQKDRKAFEEKRNIKRQASILTKEVLANAAKINEAYKIEDGELSNEQEDADDENVNDNSDDEDAESVTLSFGASSVTERSRRELMLIAQKLNNSTKNILRACTYLKSPVSYIREHASISDSCKELVYYLEELKTIIFEKLLITPLEDAERSLHVAEVMQLNHQHSEIIQKLEAELNNAVDDKEMEVQKLSNQIRLLQADMHQRTKFSEEAINRTKQEAEKQEMADIKNSERKMQKLLQEKTQFAAQLNSLLSENRDRESALRTKRLRVETAVEGVIGKYDQEMGDRQDQYEIIDAAYTEDKKQLHELEERFKSLDEEYKSIMEERRIAQEKRLEAERQLLLSVKAATTIQAFWRSFKVRKMLKAKSKKKGKK